MKAFYILIAVLFLLSASLIAQENDNNNYPKGQFLKASEIQRSKTFKTNSGNTDVTELFYENFESGGTTWSANGSWQIGAPTSGPMSGYSSTNCAATNLSGNYSDGENSWLISEPIVLPSSPEQILLKYYEWFAMESGYDNGRVQISTNNGANWVQIFSCTGTSAWRNTILDITTYKGNTVLLGFNFTSDGSVVNVGWYIDDIRVESTSSEPLDATITSLNSQNFPLIYMNVAVDTFGVGISTLNQANFQVFENGVLQTNLFEITPPQTGGGQRLADIVFCVDVTGSMEAEIASVKANILSFINAISLSDINYRIGFITFGDIVYVYNSYNLYSDLNEILSIANGITLGENGIGNGGDTPENQLSAMSEGASFNFRPGAQRIEIMLTDAPAHENDGVTPWTVTTLIDNRLLPNNMTVFPIFDTGDSQSLNQYIPIANATNPFGTYFYIYDNFNTILNEISSLVSNNYIVRYSSNNTNCNGITRNVEVIVNYGGNQASATRSYFPCQSPIIVRTPGTIALHNQAWAENTEFTIDVEVTDNVSPYVNDVKLFFKNTTSLTYQFVVMANVSGMLWRGVIPSASVTTPGIDYYITGSDGEVTVSDPSIEPSDYPYQLAILPNQAPVIVHTPIEFYDVGQAIDIFAQISDNTNALADQKLFYRMRGQILYENATMTLVSGTQYHALIPAGFATPDGIDYYISAWDNFGVRTDHGSATDPHEINVLDQLIVTPDNHDVSAASGLVTYEVQTQLNWNVTDDADWITINPTSGSGNGSLLVNYESNNTGVQRVANITVSSGNGMPQNYLLWFSDTASILHGFNVSGTNSFSIAARFTLAELAPYDGSYLQLIGFFPGESGCNYVLKVWSGIDSSNLVLRHQQLASGYTVDDWNDVVLTSPVLINASEELWIGYTVTYSSGTFPAVTDNGPAICGFGDRIYFNNNWQRLCDYGYDYNWLIYGFVDDLKGSAIPTVLAPNGVDQLSDNSTNGKLLSKGMVNAGGNKISKFPQGANESGKVSKTVTLTQAAGGPILDEIILNIGWNLISFDVIPNPDDPATVFQTLISTGNLLMVTGFQNQIGVFFNPNGPVFLNTLQHILPGEGYWIKVQNPATITIEEPPIPPTLSVNLESGWNLIGYWPMEVLIPEVAFAPLISAGILQMVTSYDEGGKFFNPFGPPFLNTLLEIENGFGYWVKLSANFNNFSYPTTSFSCGDLLNDSRDGQTYSTVQIGSQCWMAENLNIGSRINGVTDQSDNAIIEKYCYNNSDTQCDVYGGIYQWNEMMGYSTTPGVQGICPAGWHLPTDAEWTTVTDFLGGTTIAGGAMKEAGTTHWTSPNTGATNSSGFTGLPGGHRLLTGTYYDLNSSGYWWSSSPMDITNAYARYLRYNLANVNRYNYNKSYGFSVRCIKN